VNDEAARQGRPDTIMIRCPHSIAADGLDTYGGEPAMRCPEYGHVSPSRLHLDRHLLRECCGLMGRAA
jgi:hypothetical protein